ncbi:MAG: hypothetical protein P8X50_14145 [Maritimibacter sp.]
MKQIILAVAAAGLAFAAHAYSGEQYVTCNLDPNGDNWLALKAAPDIGAKRLAKIGPGTFLITMNPEPVGQWREVIVQDHIEDWSYEGPSGWVHVDYICEVRY